MRERIRWLDAEPESPGERRATQRTQTSQMVHITALSREGTPVDFTSGQSINISKGGMRIRLISHPFPVDSFVRLSFELNGSRVEMDGKVIYVEQVGGFVMGVQFIDLMAEVEKTIRDYVDSSASRDWDFKGR